MAVEDTIQLPAAGLDRDDILSALSDETDETPAEEISEEDETVDDSDDSEESEDAAKEESESEEPEEEEPIAEDLDYTEIPRRQEVLKAYPDFDKKFPGIFKAVYREQQYSEVFPTITEAKEAVERVGVFNKIESDLLNGNIEDLFTSIKGANGKAFDQITGQLLSTLRRVDEKAYYGTLNQVISNALSTAFEKGKGDNDDQLQIAAQLINKFIYGTTKITPVAVPVVTKAPEATELTKREEVFAEQQLNVAVNDITTRTDNTIKATIDKHLDPKGVMTKYLKGKATEDALKLVREGITAEPRFKALLNNLWKEAHKANYNEASKLKIRNALISRAKTLLPGVLQKVKAEALRGSSSRKDSKDEKSIAPKRLTSSKPSKEKAAPAKNMSTFDFLNQD